jgi:phospholipid/cholesterol/gamma-HCH transport system substrate-binding protein
MPEVMEMAEIPIRISDRVLRIIGILLVGICLAWVVTWLWSSGVLRPKYRLRTYVSEASGLALGAPVRVDGLEVGTVDAITLAKTTTNPELKIELVLLGEKRYQDNILSDSVATVVTEGLLGNRYVNIQRGLSGKPVPTGGEIPAAQLKQVTFTDVIDSVSKVANCLNEEKHRAEENRITPRETVPRTRH